MMGFQYSSKSDGKPMRWGRSGRATEVKPRAALRRISRAPSSGSAKKVMPSGMMRVGYGEYHSSKSQSFQARVVCTPSSVSLATENTRPQNPVICEGKLREAHTPLMSMSRMRASMSQQPGRIWSNRNGSSATVSGRRPATAFIPTCVYRLPSNSQTWWPSGVSTTRGAWSCHRAGSRPSNIPGGSTR